MRLSESITQLLNIPYRLLPFDDPSLLASQPFAKECGLLGEWDLEGRPTCLVAFQSDEDARRLCGRMISVRYVPLQKSPSPQTLTEDLYSDA